MRWLCSWRSAWRAWCWRGRVLGLGEQVERVGVERSVSRRSSRTQAPYFCVARAATRRARTSRQWRRRPPSSRWGSSMESLNDLLEVRLERRVHRSTLLQRATRLAAGRVPQSGHCLPLPHRTGRLLCKYRPRHRRHRRRQKRHRSETTSGAFLRRETLATT